MPKRRLSKQQRSRISKRTLASAETNSVDNCEAGIVVSHHGKQIEILAGALFEQARPEQRKKLRSHIRANLPLLVCGDRVLWRVDEASQDLAVVEQLETRDNLLQRPRPFTEPKPVAANIGLIVLVLAVAPLPISSLIDRYLIAAEQIDVEIVIVLNKLDLLSLEDSDTRASDIQELEELAELYTGLGYPLFGLSTKKLPEKSAQQNVLSSSTKLAKLLQSQDDLLERLNGQTSILVGQSGVGKSSLINLIAGDTVSATGEISSSNEKGKHTTTNSTLHLFASDSAGVTRREANSRSGNAFEQYAIIDSPGIREFGLWHLDQKDIINGMREFRALANDCQFRDCDHERSKGCAILAALDEERIHPRRAASYRTILASLERD